MTEWPMVPSGQWLCQNETLAGYKVVRPGDVDWLTIEDWHPMTIVSVGRNRVRLVAMQAQHPGQGAFKRLVATIIASGSQPVVVEPFDHMESILKRWGWKQRLIGIGNIRQTIWYPDDENSSQSAVDNRAS